MLIFGAFTRLIFPCFALLFTFTALMNVRLFVVPEATYLFIFAGISTVVFHFAQLITEIKQTLQMLIAIQAVEKKRKALEDELNEIKKSA